MVARELSHGVALRPRRTSRDFYQPPRSTPCPRRSTLTIPVIRPRVGDTPQSSSGCSSRSRGGRCIPGGNVVSAMRGFETRRGAGAPGGFRRRGAPTRVDRRGRGRAAWGAETKNERGDRERGGMNRFYVSRRLFRLHATTLSSPRDDSLSSPRDDSKPSAAVNSTRRRRRSILLSAALPRPGEIRGEKPLVDTPERIANGTAVLVLIRRRVSDVCPPPRRRRRRRASVRCRAV